MKASILSSKNACVINIPWPIKIIFTLAHNHISAKYLSISHISISMPNQSATNFKDFFEKWTAQQKHHLDDRSDFFSILKSITYSYVRCFYFSVLLYVYLNKILCTLVKFIFRKNTEICIFSKIIFFK